jgi:hypothetical protein
VGAADPREDQGAAEPEDARRRRLAGQREMKLIAGCAISSSSLLISMIVRALWRIANFLFSCFGCKS